MTAPATPASSAAPATSATSAAAAPALARDARWRGWELATLAALLLGIADVAGKYYVPKLGAFIVYCLMIAILLLRPQGLFARAGR